MRRLRSSRGQPRRTPRSLSSAGSLPTATSGIAKAQGRIQVTRDGQIKGKLAYMPPEQLAGRELTRAVDIYASAVVMWETHPRAHARCLHRTLA